MISPILYRRGGRRAKASIEHVSAIPLEMEGQGSYNVSKKKGAASMQNYVNGLKKVYLMPSKVYMGDSFGRKIIFHTHTGDVFVNRFDDRRKRPRPPKALATSVGTAYKKGA